MPHRNIVVGQPIDAEKLEFARVLRRTMTPAEARLWSSLRGRKLNGLEFRRQQIIEGYVADFYCPMAGLVIELDGSIHDAQGDYDANRDLVMLERGLRVIRYPNGRIHSDLESVLSEIASFARSATPDLTPRPLSEAERGSQKKAGHDRIRTDRR
jgi:very-short-patch-repair endonuclease